MLQCSHGRTRSGRARSQKGHQSLGRGTTRCHQHDSFARVRYLSNSDGGGYCQFGLLGHLLLVMQNSMLLLRRMDFSKTVCYCPLWHIASHTVPIAPSRLSRITSILLNTALLGWVRGKSSRAAAICKGSKQYCGSIKPTFKREINPLFIPMQMAALKDKVSSHSCILLPRVVN